MRPHVSDAGLVAEAVSSVPDLQIKEYWNISSVGFYQFNTDFQRRIIYYNLVLLPNG